MNRLRMVAWASLALLGAGVLAAPRVAFPADTGTWAPLALPATSVDTTAVTDRGILAAHDDGLTLVGGHGMTVPVEVPAPVRSVAVHGDLAYVGTTDGLVALPLDGRPARRAGLDGVGVHALAVGHGVLYAGTARGLHRRAVHGRWTRIWPRPDARHRPVTALVAVGDTVVFLHDDSVHRWRGSGTEVVIDAADHQAVSLSRGYRPGQVWAGLRGGALLLESEDSGETWTARGEGLGFSAVNDVTSVAGSAKLLLAGGSGLADGAGNAGVQVSRDGGRSWQSEQNRLSNSHVFAVESRQERLTVEVTLPVLDRSWHPALPRWHERSYAATNGGGVYSIRRSTAMTRTLASLHRTLRTAEPVLLGLLALVSLVPAYARLARAGTRGGVDRSPTDVPATTRRKDT
jgi:hypothetical protein